MYLNELCVNVQPCDVILNCPVLAQVLDVLLSGTDRLASVRSSLAVPTANNSAPATHLPLLTASALPLLYINTSRMRLFVPRINSSDVTSQITQSRHAAGVIDSVLQHDASADETTRQPHTRQPHARQPHARPQGATRAAYYDVIRESKQPRDDVLVFELLGLSLLPQADNPLPRLVVDGDIYRRAMQAGLTSHPGADVEDRQYQLDVVGWSLSTGQFPISAMF